MLKSTLALKKSDDLFEKSSMSFGEHLEELRRALIKAFLWLGLGLCVGIPAAPYVVKYMQTPLVSALEEFYRNRSKMEMEASSGTKMEDSLNQWMIDNRKASDVIFVDLDRLRKLLLTDESLASTLKSEAAPATSPDAKIPAGEKQSTEIQDGGKAIQDGGKATAPDGKDSKPAKTAEEIAAGKFFANPDSQKLPTPERLVALRTFVSIRANAEALSIQEPMMIWFKAALLVSAIVASPGIFYHIWGFVASGLYPHERRYVYFFLPASVGLFWIGALFAFFVVFQLVISFLLQFNAMMGVGTSPRLNDYMSFALMLPLGFGVSFQLPLVMLILERIGIMSVKTYIDQWRMAIFVIAVISMILTPADWYSMIAMAIPLIFLYFLGILLCQYLPRGKMMSGRASDPR